MSTSRSQTYSTAGSYTWTAPANVSAVFAMILGGGSGGSSGNGNSNLGGGGGGSGEFCHNKLIPCAGGTLTVVVGAAGTGAVYSGQGTAGGDSSVGLITALGSPLNGIAFNDGNNGGGPRGGLGSVPANTGAWGTLASPHHVGGAGGGGHSGVVPFAASGAPGTPDLAVAGDQSTGPSFTGAGCAGASSPFGGGGNGGDRSLTASVLSGHNASGTGAGGGGGGSASSGDYGNIGQNGGDGMPGIVVLTWVE